MDQQECSRRLRSVRDVMDLLNGKWKIPIITLLLTGPRQFNEMKDEINGISAKMLSKELKELEVNELIDREVQNTKPITVKYSITEYGQSLAGVIKELSNWGQKHRDRIMG